MFPPVTTQISRYRAFGKEVIDHLTFTWLTPSNVVFIFDQDDIWALHICALRNNHIHT